MGGIRVKLGGENHSLKTQTYEAGLVRKGLLFLKDLYLILSLLLILLVLIF